MLLTVIFFITLHTNVHRHYRTVVGAHINIAVQIVMLLTIISGIPIVAILPVLKSMNLLLIGGFVKIFPVFTAALFIAASVETTATSLLVPTFRLRRRLKRTC